MQIACFLWELTITDKNCPAMIPCCEKLLQDGMEEWLKQTCLAPSVSWRGKITPFLYFCTLVPSLPTGLWISAPEVSDQSNLPVSLHMGNQSLDMHPPSPRPELDPNRRIEYVAPDGSVLLVSCMLHAMPPCCLREESATTTWGEHKNLLKITRTFFPPPPPRFSRKNASRDQKHKKNMRLKKRFLPSRACPCQWPRASHMYSWSSLGNKLGRLDL